ncbi:MAG: transglycosylase domain-containing protein [Actinomycetota bacterium]|nr:transglycosylase domain-containing protein [Actinomycetota bacterium]
MPQTPLKTFIALLSAAAIVSTSCAQLGDLPRLSERDLLPPDLAQSSKIYDRDNRLITTLHEEQNRTIIPLRQVPKHVQEAVIAIEDQRFYEHDGVDVRAILRAIVANAASGEIREGGSTITQQYVKNILIAPGETAPKTFERKINEAALARQLEQKLSKQEILERYLNTVYFGEGAYGLEAAAKTYFGKPARKLNLHEGAMLAGIIRLPEQYDPYKDKIAARTRRDTVIDKMAQLDFITESAAAAAKAKKVKLQRVSKKDTYPAPYFLDYVQRLITYDPRFRMLGKTAQQRQQQLFTGGLKIHTTVDLDMQAAAEAAVNSTLPNESDPHGSLVAIQPNTGEVRAMVGGRDWFARPKEDPHAKLNLAIAAEPVLGRVRVPCDPDEDESCPKRGFIFENRAPGTGRQAGSAFKPFALAAAINEGVSLSKSYKAKACMTFPGADNGGPWDVCNYEESEFGAKLPLLEATVFSVNVVYAQLILEIGPEKVVEVAEDMGINTPLPVAPSVALGTGAVNPLGMTSAYSTFATNGIHHPPVAITKITDSSGKVIYDKNEDETLEKTQALEPAVAYITTSALEQVMQRGTGVAANIGRPAAGKTGTAQEYRDAWFGGYTPDLAAAVWVGYPEGEIEMKQVCSTAIGCKPTRIDQKGVTGGSYPADIWAAFMRNALAGTDASAFEKPDFGFVTKVIDIRTGCLASKLTPEEYRQSAVFPTGTAPKETCRAPRQGRPVPDVFGFPVGEARAILEDEGFEVETIKEYSGNYPPGTVIGQDPRGGQKAPVGSTVILVVSTTDRSEQGGDEDDDDETNTVPDVLGMQHQAARNRLQEAGYQVDVIEERESGGRARHNRGKVWKQRPAGGSEAEPGSTVTIWVNP